MEEILELKEFLKLGDTESALRLVEDLEELGRKSLERNISCYVKVLLIQLIKQQIEKRTTKSWERSIRNAIREIKDINARPKKKGNYFSEEEIREIVIDSLEGAIDTAAWEVEEGIYDYRQIKGMINNVVILEAAMTLLGY